MQKAALCIGINDYPGTGMDLGGCVNDARDWAAELGRRGFAVSQLLDEQATKAAMVSGFRKLIGDAASGDLVVVTFSGHGTYAFDVSGDDLRGFDQALCPHDIEATGQALIDDEIHDLFKARKDGVRIVSTAPHSCAVECSHWRRRRSAAHRDRPISRRWRVVPPTVWQPADCQR